MHIESSIELTHIPFAAQLAKTDLHLLAVFIAVVDAGGFSAAQVTLNVDQSTISRQMSNLETRLGVRLCQRGRAGFRLTHKGQAVYDASQKLFRALHSFRGEVGALRGRLVGELSIAVVDNWAGDSASPFPAALAALKTQGPDVQINLHCVASDEIERAVLAQQVDVGIGVFHQHRPGLRYKHLYDDTIELYCGRRHPLFERASSVRLHDLNDVDYVRRTYLSEEHAAPNLAHLPSSALAHQLEGIAFLILSGHYVGYLPVAYARSWVRDDAMRKLNLAELQIETPIEIAMRRGVRLSLVAATFLELLHEQNAST